MKYDAFISYRHAELDMYIAKKVHKGLENFHVPKSVAKKGGKKKIQRVFRDQEELPIGSNLGDNIFGALEESEFLIVICSPRLPQSEWCKKEIETFISMHGRDHVLAVLIEGEPDESFPDLLRFDAEGNPVEPLAADVRGTTKAEIDKKFKTELMRLAAPLLYCSYDDLKQRHKEYLMKRAMALTAGIGIVLTALGIGFGIYNAGMVKQIEVNYEQSQINQSKYLSDFSGNLLSVGDRRAAALVALEALPSEDNPRPYVCDAERALANALYTYNIGAGEEFDRILSHELPVDNLSFSQDGKYITTILTNESVSVWDAEQGKLLLTIAPSFEEGGYVKGIEYANVYKDKVYVCDSDGLTVYSLEGEILNQLTVSGSVSNCIFSPTEERFAIVSLYDIYFYETDTLEELCSFHDDLYYYSFRASFSPDGRYLAINHETRNYFTNAEELTGSRISLIDIDKAQVELYYPENNVVNRILTNNQGEFLLCSYKEEKYVPVENDDGTISIFLEKYGKGKAEPIWQREQRIDRLMYVQAAFSLLPVQGKDNQIIYVCANHVRDVDWDGNLGFDVALSAPPSGIAINPDSMFAYVKDGNKIASINLVSGINATGLALNVRLDISDLSYCNGILAIRTASSPNVTLLKNHQGTYEKEVCMMDTYVPNTAVAPDESSYVLYSTYENISGDDMFVFFDGETDERIGEIPGDNRFFIYADYVRDNIFLCVDRNGSVLYYDCQDNTTEQLQQDGAFDGATVSPDKQYMVLYGSDMYHLLDIENRTLSAGIQLELESDMFLSLDNFVVSGDGKEYLAFSKGGVYRIDASDGGTLEFLGEEYNYAKSLGSDEFTTQSPAGDRIAIVCRDGYIRIYDFEKKQTMNTIPFKASIRCMVHYTEDGRYLIMQGDDYYFRIYDLENDSFIFASYEQNYIFRDVEETLDGNYIVLRNASGLVLFKKEPYGIVTEIANGAFYLSSRDKIYVRFGNGLYQFRHKSMEELMEDALVQFGDEPLTEMERLKYNID